MKNSSGIFIGIVAAAAAGITLALLISPKGKELRKSMKDKAGDWSKKISNQLVEGVEQIKNSKT